MSARTHSGLFDRVVCGVDPSEEGLAAARLAARVTAPQGSLALVTVDDPTLVVGPGVSARVELGHDFADALERARAQIAGAHPAETVLLTGRPADDLRAEIERREATLAVVGSHGHSRPVGIVLGSIGTMLLHEAKCSVLVAREPEDEDAWPRSIVVGVDGSHESARAYAVARELGERFGAAVRAVVAVGHGHPDLIAAWEVAPALEKLHEHPVTALARLSEETDLVVVGSRGLRGIRSLGSVSERVAHEARSSVLVVRSPYRV